MATTKGPQTSFMSPTDTTESTLTVLIPPVSYGNTISLTLDVNTLPMFHQTNEVSIPGSAPIKSSGPINKPGQNLGLGASLIGKTVNILVQIAKPTTPDPVTITYYLWDGPSQIQIPADSITGLNPNSSVEYVSTDIVFC